MVEYMVFHPALIIVSSYASKPCHKNHYIYQYINDRNSTVTEIYHSQSPYLP